MVLLSMVCDDALKIAIKIRAVSVLASEEGTHGFSFLFSLCDRTVSNYPGEIGAGWWESAPKDMGQSRVLPTGTA